MVETQARVLATEQAFALVEPRPHSSCRHCDPVAGCRALSLSRTIGSTDRRVRVHNPLGAEAGDWVLVTVPRQRVSMAAFLVYLVPPAGLGVGLSFGAGASEPVSLLAGAALFVIGLYAVRRELRRRRRSPLLQPTITAIYPSEPLMLEKPCRSKN
nr:SoxR reducing system RseC family protein [uncultured Pseudogulbenkiania sp.]